jgi:hypothetical protein
MTPVFIFVANFSLPDEEGTPFQEILYVELAKDEAKEVVDLYNKVSLFYLFFLSVLRGRKYFILVRLRGAVNPFCGPGSRSSSYLNMSHINIKNTFLTF